MSELNESEMKELNDALDLVQGAVYTAREEQRREELLFVVSRLLAEREDNAKQERDAEWCTILTGGHPVYHDPGEVAELFEKEKALAVAATIEAAAKICDTRAEMYDKYACDCHGYRRASEHDAEEIRALDPDAQAAMAAHVARETEKLREALNLAARNLYEASELLRDKDSPLADEVYNSHLEARTASEAAAPDKGKAE